MAVQHVVKIIQKYFYSSVTGPTLLKVRIFSYIDRIVSVFFRIWTDSPILSKKYGYDSVHVQENTDVR